jgi:predicted DNA-binding transcriptional regulator AlpA
VTAPLADERRMTLQDATPFRPTRHLTSRAMLERYGGIDARTLYRWIRKGQVPKPMLINGRRYWNEAEVDALDEKRKSVTTGVTMEAA